MNKNSISSSDYFPQRIGLSHDTKQIVIEYLLVSSQKLYHHKMNLSKFSDEHSVETIVNELYIEHSVYLDHPDMNREYITNAVNKLMLAGRPSIEKAQAKEVNIDYNRQSSHDTKENSFESNEDFNGLTKEELDEKKREMDKRYEENRIKVEDKDFQYDIREDFDGEIYDAEWDD